ncbi:MAG: high frequency lysogenization protein HflD [Methylicorpusculum sp.]|uniref:high frequency lysogenization protein HflD n=1 Tax=Methylicorpusculum sp. TaxID=2713644 RepID=UPI0027265169|nr:high frequency lysogenization protein HflD [Methylicorpusculum sp.]MDO8844870.1 high frequency lysogenization protein HflD [Methylicorpusculum sp.]MDO8938343.1 high frequency lysogenization protein HflD [Methylicorpusculum sp.]MDO9240203.1 high frequency lysogenization protein HflD [Methylicorpusculum sp.]MDP2180549.1 high frequency lysogenization protein HflD [Methylicorpusculum sp.]MDP2200394.1 high frequency lysogenization protein HflD [Methylicorpusculum sp.]
MHLNTIKNQAIALAGVAQSAALVQQLATQGKTDQSALENSVASILKIESDSVEAIFNGLSGIKLGLEQLNQQLNGFQISNPEQARYAASLVFLEKQLSKRPDLLKTISQGIEKAQQQRDHFGLLHENVFANLGDTYHNTISTLQPRIMVNGEQNYLSQPEIVNKIRTLLLAGIRAAMLWRQCGGTRWKFLFYRKKLQAEIENLLKQI